MVLAGDEVYFVVFTIFSNDGHLLFLNVSYTSIRVWFVFNVIDDESFRLY